ncbi:50S ribosomal protein L19e [Candidatus Woesearchaeota archaeon]|nr:50S ribosomal protein L19e [Candidatus Woesearchaeota archaeon]
MNLQKRLAAQIMKCSPQRVHLAPEKLTEITEAITKTDIRTLIKKGTIQEIQKQGISQSRTRHTRKQKRKGRQQGQGSRKGKHNARLSDKDLWINTVRLQRKLLKTLREKKHITPQTHQLLYAKSKGGFFRSLHHLKVYINERNLITK